ncbi:DEAD/DEAH box helicase [Alteribacter natronophilus]|uniref:DEAD/DEAH box helicase n=1 Tax=Alteribacter natronophilus TaxID=2583810 RepID=UPI00110E41BA|nr:DEAD/DEAH box helicase [Alteribacter natronophilus]TMW72064.1 DEAD/DEAH box helicase [Alteribacter natronophilus]
MNGFTQLDLDRELIISLEKSGITEPTPVQEQVIPVLGRGENAVVQSQTGTGKTLAFVLPILEKIDTSSDDVQALILAPTRELAVQISSDIDRVQPRDVKTLAVYGGQDIGKQLHRLGHGAHLIVATPGRLLDHLRRGTVELSGVRMLVLDEADQMLHMGFLNEVEDVIRETPKDRQMMLFSATMPKEIRTLSKRYMNKAAHIKVDARRITVEEIEQGVVETTDRRKQASLRKMLDLHQPFLAIIFCRTKRRTAKLSDELKAFGYNADELHGDLSQAKREKVMKQFRDMKVQFLVATDVAARGLDVEGVTHVYNYDIPHDTESYVHRIGRTGRAGKDGLAVTFAAPKDRMHLEEIEKGIGFRLKRIPCEVGPDEQLQSEQKSAARNREPSRSRTRNKSRGPGRKKPDNRGGGGGFSSRKKRR